MSQVIEYAHSHFTESVEKLKKLVAIPSCSFPGFPKAELTRAAEAVASLMKEEGLENVELLRHGDCPPYVYADWLHAQGKPTVLIYAHYDVQPIGNEATWKSPAYVATERDGRLYGRGTADDKAGIVMPASAIGALLKTTGRLPVNVKLLFEGEEEYGSTGFEGFLKGNIKKLKADGIIIADCGNYDTGVPTITTSLRGIIAMSVTVKAMEQSLHSGTWGGPGPDPVIALSKMIASLVDNEGRVTVPGFYDKVRKLTPMERKSLDRLNYTNDEYRRQGKLLKGVQIVGGPESPQVKMTRMPALSVNAIQASSRKEVANVVTCEAWCRVGIRTVPDMDGVELLKKLKEHLKKNAPWGVEVTFSDEIVAPWWITEVEHPMFQKAATGMEKAYGKPVVYLGAGGNIGFVEPFCKALGGIPALLVGAEDPYTNAHSENESVNLADLQKGIDSMIYFFESLGD